MNGNIDIAVAETEKTTILQMLNRYVSLATLLRTVGAGILVASVSMFLFTGWTSGDDIERYLMLLAQTVLMAAAGVGLALGLKESKGARVFIGLSLIAAVVNYAVLGGLIYSQFQWDGSLITYPSFAHWQSGSASSALITAFVGIALLIPIAVFGFLVMARRSAIPLTAAFTLSGLALLLPVRQSETIALLVAAVTVALLVFLARTKQSDPTLAAGEGMFARLLCFGAPAIMVGRAFYLYSPDLVMVSVLSGLMIFTLREISKGLSGGFRSFIELASLLPCATLAVSITALMEDYIPWELFLPVSSILFAALCAEIALRSSKGKVFMGIASFSVLTGMLGNLYVYPGVYTALVSTLAGLVITVWGYTGKRKLQFAAGLLTLLVGIGYQCALAFNRFDFNSWTALAVIGVLVVVSASVLERHGAVIKVRFDRWRQSIRQW